jgi:hypothetical protein
MTRLPLVQLLEHDFGDPAVTATYADAIGIAKALATTAAVRCGACGPSQGARVDLSCGKRISAR